MSGRVFAGKWTTRRDKCGVSVRCDGLEVNGVSMSEMRSAEALAAVWRHLSGKPWMTRELFEEIGGHICVLLNVP